MEKLSGNASTYSRSRRLGTAKKIILERQSTINNQDKPKLMKNIGTFWEDPLCGIPKQSVQNVASGAGFQLKCHQTLHQFFRVMKLTIFIMTLFLLQVSAASNAQITLNAKQESLLNVLDKISKQSGYGLICTVQDFKNASPVTLKLNNVSVAQALKEVFSGQPLIYEVSEKTVMVKRKEEKENSIIDKIKNYLASITIAGTVQDEKGVSLPGVNVKIKNGKGNTLTGTKGEFTLKNITEGAIVELTYVGYKKKELPAQEMMGFIRMELSENKLDEVQIGFSGTTSRRTSTSNIATIKGEDIAKQPVDNPLYALMGRVPGLIITPSSGNPNSPVRVQLRGQNSLQKDVDSEPLFVVDGVPFLNTVGNASGVSTTPISALSFINPLDIESIDVLKDADATAIYGSRGANGVILITTKKGRIGSTKIDVNLNFGFSTVSSSKTKMMNTQQYLEMRKEAYSNDGLPIPDRSIPTGEKNLSNYDLTVWDPSRYTDWQKVLTGRIGKNQQANMTITGGNELIRYSVAGTYTRFGLPLPGTNGNNKQEMGIGTFNINGNSLNKKLQISLTASYNGSQAETATDLTYLAFTLPPNAPELYNSDGSLNWEPNLGSSVGEATWTNPLASLLNTSIVKSTTVNVSSRLSYDISSKLKLSLLAGFNKVLSNRFYVSPISAQDPAFYSSNTGLSQSGDTKTNNWSIQPQLNYLSTIANGKLDILIGGAMQKNDTFNQFIEARGYTNDALLGTISAVPPGGISGGNSTVQYKYGGIFGKVTYNWDNKYIINLSGRRDGSSRFGPGSQFGNFGSIGTAWIFSNEKFLKDKNNILSFGKLRTSFGTSGNDAIGDYRYLELFTPGSKFYQGRPVLESTGVNNPDYHWEHKKSFEFGFDLGFFKERLLISGSYFRAIAGDQLLSYPLPATAGGSILINQEAKIQNSGMELLVNSVNLKSKEFRWSTSINLSFANKNKIISLPNDADLFSSRLVNIYDQVPIEQLIGKPFAGLVAVYEFRGIDPLTGFANFADKNGNTVSADAGPYQYAKLIDLNPKFYGGFSNQFSYKGFSLDIFMEFKKQIGRSIFNANSNGISVVTPGQPTNLPVELLNRWRMPGDNAIFQRASQSFSTNFPASFITQSDIAYTDASYLRVKTLALSYELPTKLKEKLGINNLRVFANAQNLLTITGYKGADPEAQTWLALPPLKTIQTGILAGF